jgi:hypothetical protein
MLLSPARQGSRLTRLGVFGPPGWRTLDKSLGLGFDTLDRHWISIYDKIRERGGCRFLSTGRGFFCSSALMCKSFFCWSLCFLRSASSFLSVPEIEMPQFCGYALCVSIERERIHWPSSTVSVCSLFSCSLGGVLDTVRTGMHLLTCNCLHVRSYTRESIAPHALNTNLRKPPD